MAPGSHSKLCQRAGRHCPDRPAAMACSTHHRRCVELFVCCRQFCSVWVCGPTRLAPLSAFLILATIPSKISLHSLIHWFLPSMTIYWAETEGRRERMMGGGGWLSVEGRVCRMMSSARSVKKSMSR